MKWQNTANVNLKTVKSQNKLQKLRHADKKQCCQCKIFCDVAMLICLYLKIVEMKLYFISIPMFLQSNGLKIDLGYIEFEINKIRLKIVLFISNIGNEAMKVNVINVKHYK